MGPNGESVERCERKVSFSLFLCVAVSHCAMMRSQVSEISKVARFSLTFALCMSSHTVRHPSLLHFITGAAFSLRKRKIGCDAPCLLNIHMQMQVNLHLHERHFSFANQNASCTLTRGEQLPLLSFSAQESQ